MGGVDGGVVVVVLVVRLWKSLFLCMYDSIL